MISREPILGQAEVTWDLGDNLVAAALEIEEIYIIATQQRAE